MKKYIIIFVIAFLVYVVVSTIIVDRHPPYKQIRTEFPSGVNPIDSAEEEDDLTEVIILGG